MYRPDRHFTAGCFERPGVVDLGGHAAGREHPVGLCAGVEVTVVDEFDLECGLGPGRHIGIGVDGLDVRLAAGQLAAGLLLCQCSRRAELGDQPDDGDGREEGRDPAAGHGNHPSAGSMAARAPVIGVAAYETGSEGRLSLIGYCPGGMEYNSFE